VSITLPLWALLLGAVAVFGAGYLVRRNNPHDPTLPKAKG